MVLIPYKQQGNKIETNNQSYIAFLVAKVTLKQLTISEQTVSFMKLLEVLLMTDLIRGSGFLAQQMKCLGIQAL